MNTKNLMQYFKKFAILLFLIVCLNIDCLFVSGSTRESESKMPPYNVKQQHF